MRVYLSFNENETAHINSLQPKQLFSTVTDENLDIMFGIDEKTPEGRVKGILRTGYHTGGFTFTMPHPIIKDTPILLEINPKRDAERWIDIDYRF